MHRALHFSILFLFLMLSYVFSQDNANDFCEHKHPKPRTIDGIICCDDCEKPLKICTCEGAAVPSALPIHKCEQCKGWRKTLGKPSQAHCLCAKPSPSMKDGQIICLKCDRRLFVCECSDALPPYEAPIKRCKKCGKWRKDVSEDEEHFCECNAPSPYSSKGKILCRQCEGVLRVCVCSGSQVPTEKPIKRCKTCGYWRKDVEHYCECDAPSPFSSKGKILCRQCEGVLRVCGCKGSQPPDKKPIEKCGKCSFWKQKIDADVPRWIAGYFFDVIYFFKDWMCYFEYLFSGYRTRYYGQSPSTPRELYHVWIKAISSGTYKTNNKDEKDAALQLRILSFLGLRFVFYCGNTVAVDDNVEYMPIAFHFPFIGKTEAIPMPSNAARMDREFRLSMSDKSNWHKKAIPWAGDLTYFPERHDANAQNAEDFVRDFLKNVFKGDDEAVKTAFVKNSPLAGQSAKELRNILPSKGKLGRAANVMHNAYVVPCMVIRDNTASAFRIIAVRIDEKMYVYDVISP